MSQSSVKITREKISEGPTTTTKVTSYKTSYETQNEGPTTYRSQIYPRTTLITRGGGNYGAPGGQRMTKMTSSQVYSSMPQAQPGAYTNVTTAGVSAIKTGRDKEKKDMQDLNERFATYIEKVRFLEAQNRKLADELNKLKERWGKETTAIKAMYEVELEEARKVINDSEKEKARLEIRCSSLEEQIEELRAQLEEMKNARAQDRETIERQAQQLSDYEAEINLLRRRIETLETDREKDKKEIARLSDLLNRARIDLDNETLNHIDAENRRQTLEEELEFIKQVHEQEMKELAALAYRDTTQENREFWKNEMGQALREIQQTYDEKLDVMRGEMETYYNLKMQEFRTGATRQNMETVHAKEETKRLKDTLGDLRGRLAELEARNAQLESESDRLRRDLEDKEREWENENTLLKNDLVQTRAEMEGILKELQNLLDTKLGLELEIAAYRKLLEGEENRVGLRNIVESMVSSTSFSTTEEDDSSLKVSQVVKGEMSAKTTYQRSAKGPVSIMECAADGKFVGLENNGRKDENLSGWRITRNIDGSDKADFTLPNGFSLGAGRKMKIWAKGSKGSSSGPYDIESNLGTWGVGANITTRLLNTSAEERATHVQRTIYTS